MKTTAKIPVLIINWNGIDVTIQCLKKLFEKTARETIQVVVTDNGSQDPKEMECLERLKEEGKIDLLIKHSYNTGFSHALNEAVRRTTGEIFCSMGNDVFVDENWLEEGLHSLLAKPDIGAVCCSVREEGRRLYRPPQDKAVELMYGPIMFFKRSVWEEVGNFDAANFSPACGEEMDWCYRARRRGYLLIQSRNCLADHIGFYTGRKNFKHAEIHLIRLTHRIKCRLFNWSIYQMFFSPRTWIRCYLPELYAEIRNGNFKLLLKAFQRNFMDLRHILKERQKRFSLVRIPS